MIFSQTSLLWWSPMVEAMQWSVMEQVGSVSFLFEQVCLQSNLKKEASLLPIHSYAEWTNLHAFKSIDQLLLPIVLFACHIYSSACYQIWAKIHSLAFSSIPLELEYVTRFACSSTIVLTKQVCILRTPGYEINRFASCLLLELE